MKIGLFGPVQTQNRTVIHAIAHDGNAKLSKIIADGQAIWKANDLIEKQKAEAEHYADMRAAHRQAQALIDAKHNVKRYPDGRIVTGGA
jgi:hypothetical protein